MDSLLERNRAGILRSGPAGRGFYDGKRRCRGVTKLLKIHLRTGKTTPVARQTAPPGARMMTSNQRTGQAVHAALAHELVCARRGCVCLTPPPAPTPYARACVAAGRAFFAARGLRPVAAELVVAHPRFPVATRIDAVCTTDRGDIVLVSWKTGAGARDACELRHHRTQVAFEWSLVEGAGQRVALAYVVYVGASIGARITPFYRMMAIPRAEALALADEFAGRLARRWPAA